MYYPPILVRNPRSPLLFQVGNEYSGGRQTFGVPYTCKTLERKLRIATRKRKAEKAEKLRRKIAALVNGGDLGGESDVGMESDAYDSDASDWDQSNWYNSESESEDTPGGGIVSHHHHRSAGMKMSAAERRGGAAAAAEAARRSEEKLTRSTQ